MYRGRLLARRAREDRHQPQPVVWLNALSCLRPVPTNLYRCHLREWYLCSSELQVSSNPLPPAVVQIVTLVRSRTAVGAGFRFSLDRCPCQNRRPCRHLLLDVLDGAQRLRIGTSNQLRHRRGFLEPVNGLAGAVAHARNHALWRRDAIPTREHSAPPNALTQDRESSLRYLHREARYSMPALMPRRTRLEVEQTYWCR